ncbi:MAG: hypothetical protein AAGA72_05185 [Pseudomonadota bacterium]
MGRRKLSRADVDQMNARIDAFNKAREERLNPQSAPRDVTGPWMSTETLAKLPHLRRVFDLNRDPLIAAQLRDMDKTEFERREDQAGRGSDMVEKDKSAPAFRPHGRARKAMDAQDFNGRWLAEQQRAVMKTAIPETSAPNDRPEYDRIQPSIEN